MNINDYTFEKISDKVEKVNPSAELVFYNVPWNSNYSDTLLPTSETEQKKYMNEYIDKYNLKYVSMQPFRIGDTLRIKGRIVDFQNVNYFYYKNADENFYYYCFLLDFSWVNSNIVEITYELDVFQTYCLYTVWSEKFNKTIIPTCKIIRNTVDIDDYFKYQGNEDYPIERQIVTQRFSLFTSLNNKYTKLLDIFTEKERTLNRWDCKFYLVLMKSWTGDPETEISKYTYDSKKHYDFINYSLTLTQTPVKSSLYYMIVTDQELEHIDSAPVSKPGLISYLEGHKYDLNNIISITPIPDSFVECTKFTDSEGWWYSKQLVSRVDPIEITLHMALDPKYWDGAVDRLNSYKVRNLKCYNGQFYNILIGNIQNKKMLNTTSLFRSIASVKNITAQPTGYTKPITVNYLEIPLFVYLNINSGGINLVISSSLFSEFTSGPLFNTFSGSWELWNSDNRFLYISDNLSSIDVISDSFESWKATRGTTELFNAITGSVSAATNIGVGVSTGNILGVLSGTNSLTGTLLSASQNYSIAANSANNMISGASSNISNYLLDWPIIEIVRPDNDSLKELDSYFNRFGYLVNKTAEPNLYQRQKWDYIQLSDCMITGKGSDEVKKKLEEIFRKGIRLHHGTYYDNTSADIENPTKL